MPTDPDPRPIGPARRALLAAGAVATLAAGGLIADKLFRGGLPAPFDFTAFWVAGHLAVEGANPYDPALVRQTQRDLGMDDTAIVIWNPPWALTLVMPVGAIPFRTAYGVWVLANLALLIGSAELLWRGLGGDGGRRWVAYLLTLTFVPTVFLIGSGQITAVVLFGLAGFLFAMRRDRPLLAGAVGALTAVKPHLLALFGLWLLLEAARSARGRRVVLGGVLVGALACVPPTLANPDVWSHYLDNATGSSSADHYHLSRWAPPLAGWWLRAATPGQPFWVQWVPLAVAAVGFVGWYFRAAWGWSGGRDRGETGPSPRPDVARDYARQLPWIVGGSLLAAPYGVWQHDLVLLLVPVFAVAVKLARRPAPAAIAAGLVWLGAANAAALAMMLAPAASKWYVWFAPCVLAGCLLVSRLADRPRAVPAPSLAAAGV